MTDNSPIRSEVNESLRHERSARTHDSRNGDDSPALAPQRTTSACDAPRSRGALRLCALMLAVMSVNLLTVTARKSITTDEIPLIPAAYYHLKTSEFRLVNEHPPLPKLLAGLPLLVIKPREFGRVPTPAEQWACVVRFWEDNRADFARISFWARVPMIALTVALGFLLFVYARDLFGARAAVLAVALYSLEPTMLAHGRVVQTDVPAAFGYLLLFYMLRRYALAPSWQRALALGLAAGLAIVAKFSMLLAAPVIATAFIVLLWCASHDRRRRMMSDHEQRTTDNRQPATDNGRRRATIVAHFCVVALAALLLVHAAYSFHSRALTGEDARWIASSFPAHAGTVLRAVGALSHVLPTDFVLGVFWQLHHNGEGHPASLLGMYRRTGWWYYFPVAFALKTTLPFLLVSLASLAWGSREFFAKRDGRFFWLLAPFVIYTAFIMTSRINIGVRYYLPAYPFLFILGGALLDRLMGSTSSLMSPTSSLTTPARASTIAPRVRRVGLVAASVMLCWCAVEAIRAYPDYVPYMNQLASGRPHWQLLSDSNVEWGDDIRGLAEYLHARGETRVRGALLGGHLTPRYYGLDYYDMLTLTNAQLPPTRYLAVGASFLNGSPMPLTPPPERTLTEDELFNFFDAYRRRTPEVVIGGSIYLFREAGE